MAKKIRYVKNDEWGKTFKNFKKSEFKCSCCGGYGEGISYSLVQTLQTLRNKYGALNITSGYRCSKCNKKVGGDTNSAHLKGFAADFYFASGILSNQSKRVAIVNEIKKMKNYHYSYCNVNGNHKNMGTCIHVDTNPIYEEVKETVKEEAKVQTDNTNELLSAVKKLIELLGKIKG